MSTVKISDVAQAAGVSLATVSRVLSNRGSVKPATREHVLQVVKELNYQPNALARQLDLPLPEARERVERYWSTGPAK